ncbi:hypothetical protein PR002_g6651 [Phytophthora rubi]|uniref:Uncharacterized protein n=1 Tax=Phytophthora rubi TaxID=129364 RepID=A0A6A3N8E4_9STRA|nr:hypothetical protein PR002_g6651 [Phytophthora rubi]
MTPAVSLTYLAIWPCGSDCEHCSLNSIIILCLSVFLRGLQGTLEGTFLLLGSTYILGFDM